MFNKVMQSCQHVQLVSIRLLQMQHTVPKDLLLQRVVFTILVMRHNVFVSALNLMYIQLIIGKRSGGTTSELEGDREWIQQSKFFTAHRILCSIFNGVTPLAASCSIDEFLQNGLIGRML